MEIVPVDVIVPPVRPVPVATLVTPATAEPQSLIVPLPSAKQAMSFWLNDPVRVGSAVLEDEVVNADVTFPVDPVALPRIVFDGICESDERAMEFVGNENVMPLGMITDVEVS